METLWQAPHRGPFWKDQSYLLRRYLNEGSDPFGHSTDEVRPHQFGAVCGEKLSVSRFKKVVPINFYIQMESNQDSAALAQQVQALVATVEELTRLNQVMKLQLQQEENRSKGNLEDEGDSQRRSDHQRPIPTDDQNSDLL